MSKHFRIPARLQNRLLASGIPVSAVLQDAGLPSTFLEQTRILATTEELFALWHGVGHHSPDPGIGLALGTEGKPEHFDPIGLAGLSSASFGEAMQQMAAYKQLTCPEEIVQKIDAEEWSLQFRWLLSEQDEPAILIDLCFAYVLSVAHHGTGTNIIPIRLELTRPRAHARLLERHFGCPVVFEASRNAIIFHAAHTALPFVTRNTELLAMLAPQLDEELKQHRGQETFPERVRATIQRKLTGRRPKMQDIAGELHISSRTLQRRLQDDGYSFQRVMEEARHQLARRYLSNPLLELNETAYLLGFEDSNSFFRAFRSWEGVPPAHWRETQRGKLAQQQAEPA